MIQEQLSLPVFASTMMGLGIPFGHMMPPPPPPPMMRFLPPMPLPPPLGPRVFKRAFPPTTFKRPASFPVYPIITKKPRFEKKPAEKPATPIEPVKTEMTKTEPAITPSLPQELKVPADMCQPLFCKLCEAKLNSPLQASAHYEGKNHAKKERMYLEKMREEKGIRGPVIRNSSKQEKKGLEEEYCKLCSVAFTSEIQAKQHYNGRNHQRRLRGEPPLPKGFYNPMTGKWQRQPPSGVPIRLAQPIGTQLKAPKFDVGVSKASFVNAFVSGGQLKIPV